MIIAFVVADRILIVEIARVLPLYITFLFRIIMIVKIIALEIKFIPDDIKYFKIDIAKFMGNSPGCHPYVIDHS